jgi:hypothetical protein
MAAKSTVFDLGYEFSSQTEQYNASSVGKILGMHFAQGENDRIL